MSCDLRERNHGLEFFYSCCTASPMETWALDDEVRSVAVFAEVEDWFVTGKDFALFEMLNFASL